MPERGDYIVEFRLTPEQYEELINDVKIDRITNSNNTGAGILTLKSSTVASFNILPLNLGLIASVLLNLKKRKNNL